MAFCLLIQQAHRGFKIHGFPKAQGKIHYTQAGHRAAEIIIQDQGTEESEMKEEKVVVPILGPGKDDQKYSQLKAEKNENQNQYFVDHWPMSASLHLRF